MSTSPRPHWTARPPNAPGARLALVEPDGTLPLAHAAVDLVWCSETLEHVADALGLLQEIRRVLRPGGRLLLTTPAHPRWRRTAIALARSTPISTRWASTCASSARGRCAVR